MMHFFKALKISILTLLFFILTGFQTQQTTGDLEVTVSNIRNVKGVVRVLLFKDHEGYPGKKKKALDIRTTFITNNKVTVKFQNVPYGTYAVSAFHDENYNNHLDKTKVGIPVEGVGTSNNTIKGLHTPSFEESSIQINSASKSIAIKLIYFGQN